jgi:predicted  nucleic acid-binding Zn-ribbon protein
MDSQFSRLSEINQFELRKIRNCIRGASGKYDTLKLQIEKSNANHRDKMKEMRKRIMKLTDKGPAKIKMPNPRRIKAMKEEVMNLEREALVVAEQLEESNCVLEKLQGINRGLRHRIRRLQFKIGYSPDSPRSLASPF